jgi:hypothetical protein
MLNSFRQPQECNSTIHNTTNTRIYDRNVPSQFLQPYLSTRPVMTKYSFMPIVDPRTPVITPLNQLPTYKPTQIFNPGNTMSPWSGFASSINKESELRNQVFALQHCSQSVYVPSSQSDLYTYSFKPENSGNQTQSFRELFKTEHFNNFNPNEENIGNGLFNNFTRQEIRNLTDTNKYFCSGNNVKSNSTQLKKTDSVNLPTTTN